MTRNILVPNLQKTKAIFWKKQQQKKKNTFACAAEQLTDKLVLIM